MPALVHLLYGNGLFNYETLPLSFLCIGIDSCKGEDPGMTLEAKGQKGHVCVYLEGLTRTFDYQHS